MNTMKIYRTTNTEYDRTTAKPVHVFFGQILKKDVLLQATNDLSSWKCAALYHLPDAFGDFTSFIFRGIKSKWIVRHSLILAFLTENKRKINLLYS